MGQVLLVAYRIRGRGFYNSISHGSPRRSAATMKCVKGWNLRQAPDEFGSFRTGWGNRFGRDVAVISIKERASGCTAEQTAS